MSSPTTRAVASRWLPFGIPDADVALLCLPHAGAGASTYRRWATGLPPWIGAWAIQPPGRETRLREEPFRAVGPLVEVLADELAGELADAPYAVFGHSLGALTAFELVHALRRRGVADPVHLFVSGRPAPQLPYRHPALRDLGLDELAAVLRSFGGTSGDVLADRGLLELIAPLLRADFAVNETYSYEERPPLDVPVTVLAAGADPRAGVAQQQAWRAQTSAAFAMHVLTGGHFAVLEQTATVHALIAAALTNAALTNPAPDTTEGRGHARRGVPDHPAQAPALRR